MLDTSLTQQDQEGHMRLMAGIITLYPFLNLKNLGKLERLLESRNYNTIHGPWTYATIDDFDSHSNVLMIGTLESYKSVRESMGADRVKGVYIECPDGVRLQRALDREKSEEPPKYKEMCRRFLADEEDYSTEKIKDAAVDRVFRNDDLNHCVDKIEDFIKSCLYQSEKSGCIFLLIIISIEFI